jgi:spore coat protein H
MDVMTPENCGKGGVRLRMRPRAARVFCMLMPVFVVALLVGCSRESDSAETVAQAQVQPQAPRRAQPPVGARPVVRRNFGYPMAEPATSREAARLPAKVESKLPIYDIRMKPEHLEAMDLNPYGEELYPARFTAEGVTYDNVKIRYRGAWARTWPKKPLKIFFDENKTFKGQRRVNLNSGWRDPSFIRETLAYRIYEACGCPASASRLVRVHLNGELRGLYVEVEQPDKEFLKKRDLKGATIFKASSRMKQGDERDLGPIEAYKMHFEQETQKDEQNSWAELKDFCAEMGRARDVADFFNRRVDVEKFINYLAASVFCQNWDWYNKNHFLVYNARESKKWFMLPWDLDRSLGDHWDWSFGNAELPIELGTSVAPAITGWNRMMDRFFRDPTLRARFADRLQELLDKELTSEKFDPIIDQLAGAIGPEARLDRQLWPVPDPDVEGAVAVVKGFIKDRRAFLLRELPRFRENTSSPRRPVATEQRQ